MADDKPRAWKISYSFTQPYTYLGEVGPLDWSDLEKKNRVAQELSRLDKTEEVLQKMLTYPDVEAILNKIRRQND